MNKTILKGRLARDPDMMRTDSIEPVCVSRFTIACEDRERKKGEDGNYPVNFIPCVAMGKVAEIVALNFQKGREILVFGKMQSGSYINSEGKKIYTLECFVKEAEFCGKKEQVQDNGIRFIPDSSGGLPFK